VSPETFLARWRALVVVWDHERRRDEAAADELLRRALHKGIAGLELPSTDTTPDQDTALACSMALIDASGQFDADAYRAANLDAPQLRTGKTSPLEHFCRGGWMWLRNPRSDFDLWWYWNEYVDPTCADVNPFLYHLLVGKHIGHPTQPERVAPRANAPAVPDRTVRRVCLFAADDRDAVVDDSVVAYLTELGRHADVFYLFDGVMADAELAKLSEVTTGAWAVRHGRGHVGSYALLAGELVGWAAIEHYDELLLIDDRCYLLRPLDDVFARMDPIAADWWGLLPVKRDYHGDPDDPKPLPLESAKRLHTSTEPWRLDHRLHLDSSFVLLRRRVLADQRFRRRLRTVIAQHQPDIATLRYEIGLSDFLLGAGYDAATFVDALYPYHPLYTNDFFTLLAAGYPLMKRAFVAENPQHVADLTRWKERVLEHVPEAPVEMLERNLVRLAPDDKLQRSLAIRTREDGTVDYHDPMPRSAFRREDLRTPKFDHWWAFPVCAYDHSFAGNERAVFEEVRDDPSIKKIILTRSRRVEAKGENVVIVPLESRDGQYYLLRSGQIFVKHGPMINVPWPLAPTLHNFINTWHGIPLKRFGLPSVKMSDRSREVIIRNNGGSRAVVTSSRMDSLAMSAAFYPASYPDMWPTGLPRNDFITRPEERLPADLRAALDRLRGEAAGRRIVMFLPTFKEGQADAYYHFTPEQISRLRVWLEENNAVLAVREHMADLARTYSSMLAPTGPIDMSSRRYPDLEVLYRAADVLISDYSSCLVDFQLTGKPVISFTYDFDAYSTKERGLFYDLQKVLPGPVCRTFDELIDALGTAFVEPTAAERELYEWKRRIFFDHLDDRSSARVVRRVKDLYLEDRYINLSEANLPDEEARKKDSNA
jgi:CDP-glycerol glycerophosphotransferase (TagB/SpsB family)